VPAPISHPRQHLTYANVVATLALFLALAGGSTAIALSGRNKVKTDDIAPFNVTKTDLAGNSVVSSKVRNRSIQTRDLGQLEGLTFEGSEVPEQGIHFGNDVTLFRAGSNTLETNSALRFPGGSLFNTSGSLVLGAARSLVLQEGNTCLAAPADSVRFCAMDPGTGKTELQYRFATGPAVTFATEP
jgi:hypothetical protein